MAGLRRETGEGYDKKRYGNVLTILPGDEYFMGCGSVGRDAF